MSLTNEQLTESLKSNKYQTINEVLIVVESMMNDGIIINTTNEQLIKELKERVGNKNINNLSTLELEDVLKNYENEEFEKVQSCAKELFNRNELYKFDMRKIEQYFKKNNVSKLFTLNSSELPKSDTQTNINDEVLTEDKFDKDIIPTTKAFGIIGSILSGLLMFFNGSWFDGLLYAIVGIMATLGLCVLLEGISTIIKLLRKISEK